MIFEIKTYVDHKGRTLYEKVAVSAGLSSDPKEIIFPTKPASVMKTCRGEGMIQTNRGPVPFPFDFPPGMSVEECFSKYEEFGQKAFEEMQKESSTKIITPADIAKGL